MLNALPMVLPQKKTQLRRVLSFALPPPPVKLFDQTPRNGISPADCTLSCESRIFSLETTRTQKVQK
jgi:hypothetical protein